MVKYAALKTAALAVVLLWLLLEVPAGVRAQAQEETPDWLINMFFVRKDFPEKAKYLTGELSGAKQAPTLGSILPEGSRVAPHELYRDDSTAVFAIGISGDSLNVDFYCYLVHKQRWMIEAIRSLWLPAFLQQLVDSLEAAPVLSNSARETMENLQLLMSSDSELTAHLTDNLSLFNTLVDDYRNNRKDAMNRKLRLLKLASVYESDEGPGCIFVSIGGITDNEAGYIYAENEKAVPRMSSHRFIMVMKVASNWFLYKTT